VILERIEGSRFSRVLPEWNGETVAVIASGASLSLGDVCRVQLAGIRTIAVNSSFLWAHFADVLYAADSHWWRWMHDGIDYPKIGVNAEEVRRRYAAFAVSDARSRAAAATSPMSRCTCSRTKARRAFRSTLKRS
jgi:hypothetical protein